MASNYRCRLFRLTKDKLYAACSCHALLIKEAARMRLEADSETEVPA